MKNSKLNYWKLAALLVTIAIALTQSVNASRSTNGESPATLFDQPDLGGEARTMDSFIDDFASYNRKGVELSKKSSLTGREFDALERSGNDLKRRVSEFKDALQSITRKLKSAGRWDNLDEEILTRVTNAEDRAFLTRSGGLRHILEDSITQLDSQTADEIVAPLNRLRPKVTAQSRELRLDGSPEMQWRVIAASYEPPSSSPSTAVGRSMRCLLATAHYATNLIVRGGSKPSAGSGGTGNLNGNMHCACDGSMCLNGDSSIAIW